MEIYKKKTGYVDLSARLSVYGCYNYQTNTFFWKFFIISLLFIFFIISLLFIFFIQVINPLTIYRDVSTDKTKKKIRAIE